MNKCGVSGSTEKWLCQFPRNDLVVLLAIALHYFKSRINWVNKRTSKKEIIKTICDLVNHTRFLKEDHLQDWAHWDNKLTKGEHVGAEFRTPTPQDVRKKGSKILKLPSVRNCFTLTMTNKLVVIINSLKVRKIKKILLYEISLSKLQLPREPLTRGLLPPDPHSVLCPQLNLLNPTPLNKIPAYATDWSRANSRI